MKVAIIGSGKVGSGLAKKISGIGHEVVLGSRDPESKKDSGLPVKSIKDVAHEADMVILAMPFSALDEVGKELRGLEGKIVVDVTNPLDENYEVMKSDMSAAEQVAKHFPESNVIKAFNTVFSATYDTDLKMKNGGKIQVFCAGDDEITKEVVLEIANRIGFEAINAGGLKNARYLESLTGLQIQFAFKMGMGNEISFNLVK